MCQATAAIITDRIRSIGSMSRDAVGPATLALERSNRRPRVNCEKECSVVGGSMDSFADLLSSLTEANGEESFPTISWTFDDDEK